MDSTSIKPHQTKSQDIDAKIKSLSENLSSNLQKALESYYNTSNEPITKRKNPDTPNSKSLFLGYFSTEEIALKSMSITENSTLYYRLPKQTITKKKKESVDKSIRLSFEKDGFSTAKLNYSLCEILFPLLIDDLISIKLNTLVTTNTEILDKFIIGFSVIILPKLFSDPSISQSDDISLKSTNMETYHAQREAFKAFVDFFGIKKSQSALISKELVSVRPESVQAENISDSDKNQYLKELEHVNLPETLPPDSFNSKLFPYQAQALTWFLERESRSTNESVKQLHHLWEEYTLETGDKIYINSCTNQVSVEFPQAVSLCKGGVLADEMGLGKTVMIISLIHANRRPPRHACKQVKTEHEGGTLIVVPLSLISQWTAELLYHGRDLNVLEYYSDKSRNIAEVKKSDVVITTYGVLTSEASCNGPLFKISWFRVVIDEAHCIRNRNTSTAKAAFKIQAQFKWALTGTPIQNSIDDLYSLVRFLEIDPWSDYLWWNKMITKKFIKDKADCFAILQRLMKSIMLRRTKESKDINGLQLINLPSLQVEIVKIELDSYERSMYEKLVRLSKDKFNTMLREGKISTHITNFFELLLRLRQFCDHPYLVMSRGDVECSGNLAEFLQRYSNESNNNYIENLLEKMQNGCDLECPVCLENCEDPVLTKCAHALCRTCASMQIEKNRNCPLCKTPLNLHDLKTIPRSSKFSLDIETHWKSSSKLDFILRCLMESSEKTVVFTQWTSMLDIVEVALKKNGKKYARLDGSMSKAQREASINEFKNDRELLIVSLKSGGQGLNLTCAERVILIDPWWNLAVEKQAIERVHRIGQLNPVRAYRLICSNTVEERILELQSKKEKIVEGAIVEGSCSINIETLKTIFYNL